MAEPNRWAAVGVCSAATGLGAAPGLLPGYIGPALQDDLGISRGLLGLLVGLFFGSTGLASVLAARWGAAFGARNCLLAAMAGVAAGCALIASVPSYAALAFVAVSAGAGYAFANVGGNLAVTAVTPPHAGGFALTLKTAGVPATAGVLALAAGLSQDAGWRPLLWWVAGAAALTGLLALRVLPAEVRERGAPRRAEAPLPPGFWVLPVAAALFIGGSQPLQSWLVIYLHEGVGLGLARAGTITAVSMAAGLVAMLAVALLADRLGARRRAVVVALIAVGTAVGMAVLITAPRGGVALATLGAVVGMAGNLAVAGLTHAVVVDRAPDAVGRASGVMLTGYYLGALVAPWGFGALADVTGGYGWSWWLGTAAVVLSAAAYLRAHRRIPVRAREFTAAAAVPRSGTAPA